MDIRARQEDLAAAVRTLMGRVFGDWHEMVGSEIGIGRVGITDVKNAGSPVRCVGASGVFIGTRIDGGVEGPLYIGFPLEVVAAVLASLLMLPDDMVAQKCKEGLDDDDLAAFREMANLLCGTCNIVLESSQMRVSQAVEDLMVWPAGDPEAAKTIDHEEYVVVSLAAEAAGGIHVIQIVLPPEIATALADASLEGGSEAAA